LDGRGRQIFVELVPLHPDEMVVNGIMHFRTERRGDQGEIVGFSSSSTVRGWDGTILEGGLKENEVIREISILRHRRPEMPSPSQFPAFHSPGQALSIDLRKTMIK
jgi:hypothetical protein